MTEDSHTPDPAPGDDRDPDDIIGGLRGDLSFRSVPWSPGAGSGPGSTEPGSTEPGSTEPGSTEPGGTERGSTGRQASWSWAADGRAAGGRPSPRPARSLPSAAILAAVGLVLALGIAGVVLFATHLTAHGSSRPGAAAAAAMARRNRAAHNSRALAELAAQVHAIVSAGASTDRGLGRAVGSVRSCRRVSAAATQIGRVVSRERELVAMASTIDMRAAASGADLKASLMSALHDSLQAGRDFLTWAGAAKSSCRSRARTTPAYSAGLRLSRAARSHRADVDALWNPIARQESYPAETASAW